MYPMNEEPPRSPARMAASGPVIQKETSYVITERIRIIDPNAQPAQRAGSSITDRIRQTLPAHQAVDQVVEQAHHAVDSLWESVHLPHLSKEMRRWLPVITSVLLAVVLISLKSHFSPNDSALSRSRFGSGHPTKLGEYGWNRETVHEKVHEALHGVKSRVKDSIQSVEDHYHHYPDQNWLKSESHHHLTAEERAAQLIEDLHEQARRLHIQDPTEVHYEPLTEAEQARLHRSARGSKHPKKSPQVPLRHDDEALVISDSHIDNDVHNATEYHRAQRLVHLGQDLRTRAESVPSRLMRHVHAIREQFVDGMEQVHDLIMKHREAPEAVVETKTSGPSYHERAEHILRELEEVSHRITDSEHLRVPVIKKSPWYMRPIHLVTNSQPLEWAHDQYDWLVSKTFGLSEDARHRAAQAEEEVRHEAARLQELMKHELRLLKLEVDRVPHQIKKASKSMKNMPLDMLEHFA